MIIGGGETPGGNEKVHAVKVCGGGRLSRRSAPEYPVERLPQLQGAREYPASRLTVPVRGALEARDVAFRKHTAFFRPGQQISIGIEVLVGVAAAAAYGVHEVEDDVPAAEIKAVVRLGPFERPAVGPA